MQTIQTECFCQTAAFRRHGLPRCNRTTTSCANANRQQLAYVYSYCQILDLGDQLDQVDEEKDPKKAENLSKKIDELEKTLGPEYLALAKGLERMDPASREGQEIVSIIESLDKSCED